MTTATVLNRQSLFDVAVQHCGTMEAAFELAMLNGVALTDDLTPGTELSLTEPDDKSIVQTFDVNRYIPATGFTQSEIMGVMGLDEGIEFWGIEFDFIVQ